MISKGNEAGKEGKQIQGVLIELATSKHTLELCPVNHFWIDFLEILYPGTVLEVPKTNVYALIGHLFIHSSVDGHLGCFQILFAVNNAAVNIGVYVLLRISFCQMCTQEWNNWVIW